MFGIIYSKTVATFPKTIFVVAGSLVLASLVVLLLLRPDALVHPRRKGKRVGGSLSALEARVESPRGRSRKNKDIRQPSLDFNGIQIPPELRAARGQLGGRSYGATSSGSGSGSGSSLVCTSGSGSSSHHPIVSAER